MVLFCLGILLVFSFALSKPLYKGNLFNPLIAFFSIWFLSFSLYELDDHFRLFYVRLSPKAELLFILSFVCFFFGALSFSLFRASRVEGTREAKTPQPVFSISSVFTITWIALALFLFGVGYKYFLLMRQFGNPFAALGAIRMASVSGELSFPFFVDILTILGYFVVANLGVLLIYDSRKKTIASLILVSLVAAYLKDTTVAGRGATLINGLVLLCTAFSAAIAKGVRLRWKHYLAGLGAAVGVLLGITTILFFRGGNSLTFWEGVSKHNYLYVVGPIPAFSVFLDEPWPSRLPGLQTMRGVYGLADMVGRQAFSTPIFGKEDVQTSYARVTKEGPFNSSGHLTYYHSDFGDLGVVVICFLLGLLGSYFFYRALHFRRPLDMQLFAWIMVYLIFSIRGVLTAAPYFWITLLLMIVQQELLKGAARRAQRGQALNMGSQATEPVQG